MTNLDPIKIDKRPYQKPRLERVKLAPEEAVLTSCKTPQGIIFGPMNLNCRGGPGGICNAQTS